MATSLGEAYSILGSAQNAEFKRRREEEEKAEAEKGKGRLNAGVTLPPGVWAISAGFLLGLH